MKVKTVVEVDSGNSEGNESRKSAWIGCCPVECIMKSGVITLEMLQSLLNVCRVLYVPLNTLDLVAVVTGEELFSCVCENNCASPLLNVQ